MRLPLILILALFLAGSAAATKPLAPSKSAGTGTPPPDAALTAPEPDSAEAAADVLETYYALIAARQYRQAWLLWGHGGKDSGMTVDEFAASFANHASYDAEIGAPGSVDAGMSQRWVEIPVTITGKLKDGSAFKLEGPVILHHIAREMDGVSEAEKSWHIRYTSGLKPAP